jgi:GNAT superfamily N-acetyltransferase
MKVLVSGVTMADVDAVGDLARRVWQEAYPEIISQAQIDYMLAQRYNTVRLCEELASPGTWWDQIRVDGQLSGFASSLFSTTPGVIKLDKLYVDPARQRLGLGGRLIAQVAQRALSNGCDTLILAVNKRNERAIAAYKKSGFVVREAVRVDIGNGFVMDDFIMSKFLKAPGVTVGE